MTWSCLFRAREHYSLLLIIPFTLLTLLRFHLRSYLPFRIRCTRGLGFFFRLSSFSTSLHLYEYLPSKHHASCLAQNSTHTTHTAVVRTNAALHHYHSYHCCHCANFVSVPKIPGKGLACIFYVSYRTPSWRSHTKPTFQHSLLLNCPRSLDSFQFGRVVMVE